MQNRGTNRLEAFKSEQEMEKRMRAMEPKDVGPVFRVGEVYPIQGYGYKLVRVKRNGLVFKPHGPIDHD